MTPSSLLFPDSYPLQPSTPSPQSAQLRTSSPRKRHKWFICAEGFETCVSEGGGMGWNSLQSHSGVGIAGGQLLRLTHCVSLSIHLFSFSLLFMPSGGRCFSHFSHARTLMWDLHSVKSRLTSSYLLQPLVCTHITGCGRLLQKHGASMDTVKCGGD